MSREANDRETCQSKLAYATREDARAAGERARRIGKTICEYKCNVCGCWHLTKKSQSPKKETILLE